MANVAPTTSTDAPKEEPPVEYQVERILDKKMVNDKVHYLIKWVGYDLLDATWEPIDNLNCPRKIDDFELVMTRVQMRIENAKIKEVSMLVFNMSKVHSKVKDPKIAFLN